MDAGGLLDPRLLDGGDVWRARWMSLRWSERRAIKGAVARGESAGDVLFAALAVGLVRRTLEHQRAGPLAAALAADGDDVYALQLRNAEESNLAIVSAHVRDDST